MITEAHEMITYCGDPIDRDQEYRYEQLRALLKNFLNKNARFDFNRISLDYDQSIRRHLEVEGYSKVCNKSGIYPSVVINFAKATSMAKTEAMRQRLEQTDDADAGECF
jgi:hypothetical protein